MNKNLEELKELSENERDFKSIRVQDFVIYYLIPVLEDFEKRLKIVESKLGIFTEEEIKEIKVGGTDPE